MFNKNKKEKIKKIKTKRTEYKRLIKNEDQSSFFMQEREMKGRKKGPPVINRIPQVYTRHLKMKRTR
jgi:hypothetical protein